MTDHEIASRIAAILAPICGGANVPQYLAAARTRGISREQLAAAAIVGMLREAGCLPDAPTTPA